MGASDNLRVALQAVIPGAVQWDMPSKAGDRTYRIWVSKPADPPPESGYPVVYVTDGNYFFATAVLQAQHVRPALIVGVGFPQENPIEYVRRRVKEFTREGSGEDIRIGGACPLAYGGADDLWRFITEELEPELMVLYSIDLGKQALFGDSLGGLFVLQALLDHPDRFQTFVAGSPAIWWNDRAILRRVPEFKRTVEAGRAMPRVLITIGSLEQSEPYIASEDYTRETFESMILRHRMVDNARELAGDLAAIRGKGGYRADFHIFDGETHGSVIPATIGRAISYALSP